MTKPLTDAEIADLRATIALWDTRTVVLTDYLAPVSRLLDEVARARALLRRIEWGYTRDGCPACGATQHGPECDLFALAHPF